MKRMTPPSRRLLPRYQPVNVRLSRGASSTMPSAAAKLSCRLTLPAAKGFSSRMTASAAARAVRPSLPRRNRGAVSRKICMMQARTTDGDRPTITM